MFSPLLLSCLSLFLVALVSPAAAIWPAPQSLTKGSSVLYLHQNIKITYNGAFVCWSPTSSSSSSFWSRAASSPSFPQHVCPAEYGQDTEQFTNQQLPYTYGYAPSKLTSKEVVQAGVSRALSGIFSSQFVPWKLHKPGSKWEPALSQGQKWLQTLQITQSGQDQPSAFKPLDGEVNESYNLTVSAAGDVKLDAVSSIGVLRGLETFSQLFYQHSAGALWYTPYAPVTIRDAPQFPHRGVMMDTARHFFPVPDILRTIDAMAWNKLNRLHVHITDSQSWPLVLPSMPEVADKGAYHPSQTYSPADIARIQRYGAERGVEVYFEIDMPGHIGVVALSHPELIVAYDELPYWWWCAEPPCGAFKLNSTAVDAFLEKLFDDVLPRVAPYAAYFHTGGDELNKNDSMLDDGIRSNDSAVLQPLLQKFIDAQHSRIRKAGLTPITWEEIPLDWNVTLGKDTVVQSWLGGDSVKALTSKGYKVIDSDYNFWVSILFTSLSHPAPTNTPFFPVPRLRPGPMAQLGQRQRLRNRLPLQRLVRPDQVLAARLLARPDREPHARGGQARARRRGGHVERDHRQRQLRLAAVAARVGRRRGALVRPPRPGHGAEPHAARRRATAERVPREDGAPGGRELAGADDVLYAGTGRGVRVCAVMGGGGSMVVVGFLLFLFFCTGWQMLPSFGV